jgi:hypothetical protein
MTDEEQSHTILYKIYVLYFFFFVRKEFRITLLAENQVARVPTMQSARSFAYSSIWS